MLETLNMKVVNFDNRSRGKNNILFDSGAKDTYITDKLNENSND